MKASLCLLAILAAINICASAPTFDLGALSNLAGAANGAGESGGEDCEKSVSDGSTVSADGSDGQDASSGPQGGDDLPGDGSNPGTDGAGSVPGLSSLPGPASVPGLSSISEPGSVPGLSSLSGPGSVPGLSSLSGPGSIPAVGGAPGVGGCENDPRYPTAIKGVPLLNPIATAKDAVAKNAQDLVGHAVHLNVDGASQDVLKAADHAANGVAGTADQIVPGVGTAALGIYAPVSGVAHTAAKVASKIVDGASGGVSKGHVV